MKFVHVLRSSPNWGQLTLNNYLDHGFNEKCKNWMFELIKKWNNIMEPNYFEFRRRVAEISTSNHHRLEADIRINGSDNLEDKLKSVDRPYVVIFCDDDDWHNPSVVSMTKDLYESNLELDAINWDHSVFLTNYKSFNWSLTKPKFLMVDNDYFHTNNYVLTDNFFDKLESFDPVDLKDLRHGEGYDLCYAHSIIDQRFKHLIVHRHKIGIFSMANKTIASYSSFLKNENMLHELSNIVYRCQTYKLDLPEELFWVEKECQELLKLYQDINLKNMII